MRERELEQELMQSTHRELQQQKDLEQLRDERSHLQDQLENLQCEHKQEKTKSEQLVQQLNVASETEQGLRDQLTDVQKQLKTFLDAKKKDEEERQLELAEKQKKLDTESEEERILRISEEYRTSSMHLYLLPNFSIVNV